MKILITGGTGSVGKALARKTGCCVIFSRNEDAQIQMRKELPLCTCITGDIRDYQECLRATKGIDKVYHLAAMKHVSICERQPQEAVKTNIIGTMNIVNACIYNGVKELVHLSTDKVVNPSNTYGVTKLAAEKIVIEAGYSVIRSGNVMGSSNSIVPILKDQIRETNSVTITDGNMTRFFISVDDLISYIVDYPRPKDIFIPPMKAFKLIDLARTIFMKYGQDNFTYQETGMKKGEKLHEWIDDNRCSQDFVVKYTEYFDFI
jgi:UDP-N-acetylglucosamine 4,6-dehydratase